MTVDLLPTTGSPPTRESCTTVGDTRRQITILLLCGGDNSYYTIEVMVELLIIVGGKGITGPFYHLIRVGIIKREITLMLSLDHPCCQGEVIKPSVLLTLPESRGDGDRPVSLYSLTPEVITEMHLGKRNLLDVRNTRMIRTEKDFFITVR